MDHELKYKLWKKWNNFIRPFSNTLHWLTKSVQYSWELRQDWDWDFHYIFKLLKYKLERTRKRIVKNNIIADVDRVAHNIRIAELLLDRLMKNDYTSVQDKEHEVRWGKIIFSNNGMTRQYVITENDKKLQHKESMRIHEHSDKMRQQDLDYLFSHLRKYIESWWD